MTLPSMRACMRGRCVCRVNTPTELNEAFKYVRCVMEVLCIYQLCMHHQVCAYPNRSAALCTHKRRKFQFCIDHGKPRQSIGSFLCKFDSRTFTEDSSDGVRIGMDCVQFLGTAGVFGHLCYLKLFEAQATTTITRRRKEDTLKVYCLRASVTGSDHAVLEVLAELLADACGTVRYLQASWVK